MLTNKKTSIRLLALVMALFMTVAVFVGCTDNSAAEAEIQAAKDAAAAAQAAADAAQKQAAEIQAQLEAAQKAAADAQAAADAAQKEIDSIHDGETEAPKAPDAIEKDPYDAATNYVTESILAEFSALKVQYLNIQQTWYTDDNYIKLAKIFDDASVALYRATTKEGVENVLTKLSADAAAIANIYTDAEAVQALIVALGNVDTDVVLNSATKVTAAENAYVQWVEDYAKYFATQGINVANYEKSEAVADDVDEIAEETFGIAVPTIAYAQNKILLLTYLAEDVAEEVFDAVYAADWNSTRYEDMTNIDDIVAAYEYYKTFVVLNAGDESPIKHSEYINNVKYEITGERFVKQYVNVIFTAWLQQYQTAIKTFINTLPEFFMEDDLITAPEVLAGRLTANLVDLDTAYLGTYITTFGANTAFEGAEFEGQKASASNWDAKIDIKEAKGDSEKYRNELEYIATVYNAEILKLDYMKDFKGKLSLEDAFRQIDAYAEKAIAEMAQTYYSKVLVPYEINRLEAGIATVITNAEAGISANTKKVMAGYIDAFEADIAKLADDAVAYMESVKTPTYDELNTRWNSNKAYYNISSLDLFDLNDYVADGYVNITLNVVNDGFSPIHMLLNGIKSTNATMIKKLGDSYYAKMAAEMEFFAYKVDLVNKLALVYAELTDADALASVNAVLTGAGQKAIASKTTDTAWKDYVAAQDAQLETVVKTVMDLDYDAYKAAQAQAKNSAGKLLGYTSKKITDNATSAKNYPLYVVADKMVVAKEAAAEAFATAADLYYNTYVDLFRSAINTEFESAVNVYNERYAGELDNVKLMVDINAYVEYLRTLTTATAVTGEPTAKLGIFYQPVDNYGSNGSTTIANYATANVDKYYNSVSGNKSGYDTKLFVNKYVTVDEVYNAYLAAMNADLDILADLVGEDDAYAKLMRVRNLAYYKDTMNTMVDTILASFKGTVDKNGVLTGVTAGYEYDLKNARTAQYLAELDKTAANIKAAINNISLLHKDVNHDFDQAVDFIDAYITFATTEFKTGTALADKDNKWAHELSFCVTYDRYYKTDAQGNIFYDWDWFVNGTSDYTGH